MSPLDAGQAPLHIQIAHRIRTRIAGGEYPVGALLPTEHELSQAFAVSRQTVRQAIQHLRNEGLLSAKKGVGTRVEAAQSASVYQYSLQSLTDVLQYATETEFQINRTEEVVADGQLASALGCRPGRRWVRLIGMRRTTGASAPLCMLEVLIDARYARAVKDLSVVHMPIFARIEQEYGETITEIHQLLEGSLVGEEHAAALAVAAGSAALRVTRRFLATGRRLIEVSISLHPANRFSYAVALKRRI
jgi:DNA-binding GntR family transcriptional regulator